jgi:hypothetical protein
MHAMAPLAFHCEAEMTNQFQCRHSMFLYIMFIKNKAMNFGLLSSSLNLALQQLQYNKLWEGFGLCPYGTRHCGTQMFTAYAIVKLSTS